MVKIRLQRSGQKKRPYYHIVVMDSRKRRDGRYLDKLGFYNPVSNDENQRYAIDEEKLSEWYKKGAQLTEIVESLVKKKGIELSRK